MKTSKFLLLVIGIFCMQSLSADDNYEKYAKATRDSVWAWSNPEFKNYTIPEKYKNESAVIIALHEEVYATGNTKIRFTGGGILGFGLNKELTYRHIVRKMIKLNDKKALEDNAELEFKETDRSFGVNVSTLYKGVVGVRVIKPDGTIKEMDMNEAVSVTEGKKDKEKNKKLTISDLQVGDILDFFYQEEGRIDYENIPEQLFMFASKYPMLSYSVHCEISKNLTTEYRLLNGAPDFTQSENEEGDFILDVKQTDIPKISTDIWTSPLREFPAISMVVLYNSNKKIYTTPNTARGKGLYKNLSEERILEDAMETFVGYTYYEDKIKEVSKLVKKYKKKNPNVDNEQLAQYISITLLNSLQNMFSGRSKHYYIPTLRELFRRNNIECKLGYTTNRFSVRRSDIIAFWDYTMFLTANNESQIFTAPTYYCRVTGNSDYEGEVSHLVTPRKNGNIKFSDTASRTQYTIPVSSAQQNVNNTQMEVSFSEKDFLTLDIDRKTTLTGYLRNGRYSGLILFSDMKAAIDKWQGKDSYIEELKRKKKQKDIDEFEAQLAEDRKNQEERVKSEINSYHDIDVKELKSYSIPMLGVTPDQPQMQYEVQYTLDGLVKRAGNNYILDVGKLISTQVTLDDNERERTVDVYMPYARSYEHEIIVKIPSGYKAENLKNLNTNLDNECGQFVSSAIVNGADLVIKVKKVYKHNFEPVSKWKSLIQVIDAANNFYGQSIVFKK